MEDNQNDHLDDQIKELMSYVTKLRDNGEISLFNALFQTDFQIIAYLNDHPDAHPSSLAESLKVTRPNIAANLRLLESRGFLERSVDTKNRRQVYVNLTERGKQFYAICDQQLRYLFRGWFTILGDEEVKHLFNILSLSSDPSVMTDNLKNFSFGN